MAPPIRPFAIGLIAAGFIGLLAPTISAQVNILASTAENGTQATDANGQPAVTPDGRYVAFGSLANNLVPGDTMEQDVFRKDMLTGEIIRISRGMNGEEPNGPSFVPNMSADGNLITFSSNASNLVPNDTNGTLDIFLYNVASDSMELISRASGLMGDQANGTCTGPSISADGNLIAFVSEASNLVPNDTNNWADVFLRDVALLETTRLSVSTTGVQANNRAMFCRISADGSAVAFDSIANNLVGGDNNILSDVFVRLLANDQTIPVTVDFMGTGLGSGPSFLGINSGGISDDGRFVCFESTASNLVANDTNGLLDAFVRDTQDDITTRVSVNTSGEEGDSFSGAPRISADGDLVVFTSLAENLVDDDDNQAQDTFLHTVSTGVTTRVSETPLGIQGEGDSFSADITADGSIIVFSSAADNIVAGDTNGFADVILQTQFDPPTVDFTAAPLSGGAPLTVEFENMTSGTVDTWDWDFGDGNSSDEVFPTHVYTAEGVYSVTLTATGPLGTDGFTRTDYISVGQTIHSLAIDDTSGAFGQTLSLPLVGFSSNFVSAFTASLSYDPTLLDGVGATLDGTIFDPNAQFVLVQLDDVVGSITLEVVNPPGVVVPPGTVGTFANVELLVNGTFSDGDTTEMSFVDGLGAIPVDNLFFDNVGAPFPPVTDGAVLTLVNQVSFVRGDCDDNGSPAQLPDAILVLNVVFAGAVPPDCLDACDFDDDGGLGLTDGLGMLFYTFAMGDPPPPPFPTPGPDPTADGLPCF